MGAQMLSGWQPGWLESVLVAVVLQLVLLRCSPEGRHFLRQHLVLALLALVAALLGWWLPLLKLQRAAGILDNVAVLVTGLLLIRLAGFTLFRVLLPMVKVVPPRIVEDILLVLAYIGWGMLRLRYAGVDLGSLVTTSAVITGIVAFSMQETLGNILGGIALQLDNSVRIGDWIKVDDVRGRVIEVHWRHTAVLTNNGDVVVIPNSILMKSKVDVFCSSERPLFRRWVYFPVSSEVSPQQVLGVVEQALRQAEIPCVSAQPMPQCIVMDFRDGNTIYAARYWLTDPLHDDTTDSHVRMHIYTALQRQGLALASPVVSAHLVSEDADQAAIRRESSLQERQAALQTVPLFASLSEEERRQLAASLRDTPFSKGDVMTRQGAVAHWLYLLVQGEADIWYEQDGGERRHLTTLQAGSVFGEMGLMTGEPRRATVTARTDALCYRLDKAGFEQILHARPEIAGECARILSERETQLVAAREEKNLPVHEREARILASIRRFFGLAG